MLTLDHFLNHDKFQKKSHDDISREFLEVKANPSKFVKHGVWKDLAFQLDPSLKPKPAPVNLIAGKRVPSVIVGGQYIATKAIEQFYAAQELTPTYAAVLMPDGHYCNGSAPVGLGLILENAISPSKVGPDIGCSMGISLLPLDAGEFYSSPSNHAKAVEALSTKTFFNHTSNSDPEAWSKIENIHPQGSNMFSDDYWRDYVMSPATDFARTLENKAKEQFSTSGDGNHFVEFGSVLVTEELVHSLVTTKGHMGVARAMDLRPYIGQTLVAILSHFGSRAYGATIANHYMKLAAKENPLPAGYDSKSSFLDFGSGTSTASDYFDDMTSALRYAEMGHVELHRRLASHLEVESVFYNWNAHNIAEEYFDITTGKDLYIHRKGSTSMELGELGVIPSNMVSPSYIVMGLGSHKHLQTSSHGSGRTHSRTRAKEVLSRDRMNKMLVDAGVTLIGADLDESPDAYKDGSEIIKIQEQEGILRVTAQFIPKIVRMAD